MTTNSNSNPRKKSSNGNISIVGKNTFERSMRKFGKYLLPKLEALLPEASIRPYIMDVQHGSRDKRLSFDIESRSLKACFETLNQNGFNCIYEPDGTFPYLRIWAIPIDFLEPRIKNLKNDWKGDFSFEARINQKGTLEIVVSDRRNLNGDDTEVMAFHDLITSSFPDLDVRKKQKPRNGSAIPGFVIKCNPAQNTIARSSTETRSAKPEKPIVEVVASNSSTLNVIDLLTFAMSQASDKQKLEILKRLLPEGVGLHNTNQPLIATSEGFKINLI